MSVAERDFSLALLDPAAPVPDGLVDPAGHPAGRRFAIYRNNVAVSLTEALETGFPVLRKLLGDTNFRGIAGVYLRKHPPSSPRLTLYGANLPNFLENLPQLAQLPYLPDVARLEYALRQSYHAADSTPVAPDMLAALPPEKLVEARIALAPAVRMLASPWPVLGIWLRNTRSGAPKPAVQSEEVLVVRQEFDPEPVLVPPGSVALLRALTSGLTLGEALEAVGETPGFDLSRLLSALISGGAITDIEVPR